MPQVRSRKQKLTVSVLLVAVISVAVIFFLLRGPYLSNTIKRVIVPVLENATGERIIIDNAAINLFPFYFQAKGLKVLDKNGNMLLWVTKTRVYTDLLGLFTGEFRVRRLTLKEPNLTVKKDDLVKVRQNVQRYMTAGEGGTLRFSLKNIKVTAGKFDLSGPGEIRRISGSGLQADVTLKNRITSDVSLKEGYLQIEGRPELKFELDGTLVKNRDGRITFSGVRILSAGSSLEADGTVTFSEDGQISGGKMNGKAKILERSINHFFDIPGEDDGELSFSGSVELIAGGDSGRPGFRLDLDTEGWFSLESLMKILKVQRTVTGRLVVDGRISGVYPDLTGSGSGSLKDAVFGHLQIDDAIGTLGYRDKKFVLDDFIAHSLQGELRGDAFITIPHGDYTVSAGYEGVSSRRFFKYISWDAPFPDGSLSGDFSLEHLHGKDIRVAADVQYLNSTGREGGLLQRIEGFSGGVDYDRRSVVITDGIFRTPESQLSLNGVIDLDNRSLSLLLHLASGDASDLTAPSFTFIRAPVQFTGLASGPYGDPEISGSLSMGPGTIKDHLFSQAAGDLTYRIGSLSTELLRIGHGDETYEVSGSILFRKAVRIFSYDDPYYTAKIVLDRGDLGGLVMNVYRGLPLSGDVKGEIMIEGDPDTLTGRGNLIVENGSLYQQRFDRLVADASFGPDSMKLTALTAYRGESRISAEGFLAPDDTFRITASSDRIDLRDIDLLDGHPVNGLLSLTLEGAGSVRKPVADFSMKVSESSLWGAETGRGEIQGRLEDSRITVSGGLLDGTISVQAGAAVSDPVSWILDVDFKGGRHDRLFASLLKGEGDDISASLEGKVALRGAGKDITMQARFTSAYFDIYGYAFRNSGDIKLELDKGKLRIGSLSLTGSEGDLAMSGYLDIGEDVNVKMIGNFNINPLKALSPRVTSLRGRGEFDVSVVGAWETAGLRGRIRLSESVASLDTFPYLIGPIDGVIFLKDDRFTLESVKAGLAGGTLEVSGVGYMKQFSLERLFVAASIDGVKIRPSEEVRATVEGDLFYETSPDGSSMTGELTVRNAWYGKRFEWKSWLLGLKEAGRSDMELSSYYGDTEMNIHLAGTDSITIDNNIARAPVEMDLTITGNLSKPGLVGKVEAKEGRIYFRSNEFDILDGRLDFTDPNGVFPVFHIQAETSVSGYLVKLNLDGVMDSFSLSLFSDPPLSDTDILTLLTSGQINKEERGFESGIAAGEATAILTGGIQDVIEEEFQQITGFERFEIAPQTTVSGAVSPKITVGKRLLDDKLVVIYSTSIGTTEEHIIRMQYDLGRNVSIVGTRDEIGSTGLDLKYRLEFR